MASLLTPPIVSPLHQFLPLMLNAVIYDGSQHIFSFQSSFYQEQRSPDGKTNLEEMELLFLQFSFNTLPTTVGGTHEKEPLVSTGGQFTAAPDLRNKLEELILLVADNLLVFYVPDVSRC